MSIHLAVAGMSLMVSYFVLSFFPRDVLDEIWDRTESFPMNFPAYSFIVKESKFA